LTIYEKMGVPFSSPLARPLCNQGNTKLQQRCRFICSPERGNLCRLSRLCLPVLRRNALFSAHVFHVLPVAGPVKGSIPFIGKFDDFTRATRGFQNAESILQDTPLQQSVIGFAAGAAQGKIDKCPPGRFDPRHHVFAGAQIDGRNPCRFDTPRDQPDRLMIQGSGCHKEDRIRALTLENLHDLGYRLVLECRALVKPTHSQGDGLRCQTANISLIFELFEALDRENAV
jgi:hypothetical protein